MITDEQVEAAVNAMVEYMFSDEDEELSGMSLQINAMRKALKAAEQAAWQPIETAPRDGTKIDIWVDFVDGGERYTEAFFYTKENAFAWDSEDDGLRVIFNKTPPKYWFPIPEAPKE